MIMDTPARKTVMKATPLKLNTTPLCRHPDIPPMAMLFASLVATGTFREFIVFDEDQACAEYILWYRRRS